MKSSARYHECVPKGRRPNLLFRQRILRLCREQPKYRRALVAACKQDSRFFADVMAWQYNPRVRGPDVVGPFVSWDFQGPALAEVAAAIDADDDLLIEKSREVGGTWLVLIEFVRRAVSLPWQVFLLVSHSEKAVNAPGDKNSLFAKIEFLIDHLPAWLVGEVTRRKESFEFRGTNSNITGAATTQKAGVGGRCTAVLLDEFGLQQDDHEIWGATADLGCRIVCSTHYGLGKKFYSLCQSARGDRRRKLVIHWSQHPLKRKGLYRSDPARPHGFEVLDKTYEFPADFEFVKSGKPSGGARPGLRSPWYDNEVRRRGSLRDVALHLDIDCQGATSQAADPDLIRWLIQRDARDPVWAGYLDFDPSGRPLQLIKKPNGPIRLWLYPDAHGKVKPGRFAFGVDVATGSGATRTCMAGADADTGERVFEFADPKIKPHEMAVLAVAVCRHFAGPFGDGARLAWECPGPGLDLGERVLELGYANCLKHKTEGRPNGWQSVEAKFGFYATATSKATLFRDYLSMLATDQFINRSAAALAELADYAYTKGGALENGNIDSKDDLSGARVNHGDMVIADALAAKLLRELGVGPPAPEARPDRAPEASMAGRRRVHSSRDSVMAGW